MFRNEVLYWNQELALNALNTIANFWQTIYNGIWHMEIFSLVLLCLSTIFQVFHVLQGVLNQPPKARDKEGFPQKSCVTFGEVRVIMSKRRSKKLIFVRQSKNENLSVFLLFCFKEW